MDRLFEHCFVLEPLIQRNLPMRRRSSSPCSQAYSFAHASTWKASCGTLPAADSVPKCSPAKKSTHFANQRRRQLNRLAWYSQFNRQPQRMLLAPILAPALTSADSRRACWHHLFGRIPTRNPVYPERSQKFTTPQPTDLSGPTDYPSTIIIAIHFHLGRKMRPRGPPLPAAPVRSQPLILGPPATALLLATVPPSIQPAPIDWPVRARQRAILEHIGP